MAVSSVVVWSATSLIVGGSLTAVTVSTNVSLVVVVPSLTVRVIVAVPLWFAAGVTVTVRFAPPPPRTRLASGTSVWSEEVAVTIRLAAAVSTSPTVTASAPVAVSSVVVWSATSLIVGGSLTAVTVRTKVSLVVAVPSSTVTVIVAVPLWFAAGVTVTVRRGAAAADHQVGVGDQRLVRGRRRDRQARGRRLDVADGDRQRRPSPCLPRSV